MKIEQNTKIVDEVRKELSGLAVDTPAQEYMAKASERVLHWISFVDEIQKQRDELVRLLSSLDYARAFISGGNGVVGPSDQLRTSSPSGESSSRGKDIPNRIRQAGAKALDKHKRWLATAELGAILPEYDAGLQEIRSSLISASMDYGRKKGLFRAKFVDNTKYWGLSGWEDDKEEE